MTRRYLPLLLAVFLLGCGRSNQQEPPAPSEATPTVVVPPFNADSAYAFVAQQVAFGPRIPNTPAHAQAADYLVSTLRRYGARVTVQDFRQTVYSGQTLPFKNIIATFNPQATKRILLAAHWDTRPFADKDPENPQATFDGANDGGSGVGVLLEIARVIHTFGELSAGVDIILFDGEDWGEREGEQGRHRLPRGLEEWWCLGSQYWSRNKHTSNYNAYYGILLDMVGARSAQFHREGYSMEFASGIVEKVWNHAQRLGFSHVFVRQTQAPITDDHYFVNTIAGIPMINIVHYEPGKGFFGDFHHTQRDNMDIISKEMLGIVGTTVLNTLYHEP